MEHDDFVRSAIKGLQKEGAEKIYADFPDFGKPTEVNGFIPDISAYLQNQKTVCEIETSETISIEHTMEQCKAFASAGYPFRLYIPKSACLEMKKNLEDWKISSRTTVYVFDGH